MQHQIGFCSTANVARIAYATSGTGPALIFAQWVSHLELEWEEPPVRDFWVAGRQALGFYICNRRHAASHDERHRDNRRRLDRRRYSSDRTIHSCENAGHWCRAQRH
jgi:hypothetical protein